MSTRGFCGRNTALIAEGKGDSEEAEALADRMDAPWHAMTTQEQDRMRGLSRDLYALAEGGTKQIPMSPDEAKQWHEGAGAALAGLDAGDVDPVLGFARRPAPEGLPRHVIPLLQAKCWQRLGDIETAEVFMKEAERHNPRAAASVLGLLQPLARTEEIIR